MTLEEAKEFMWLENNKNPSVIKWQHHKTIRNLVEKLIDQLFNEHEVQLKAKYEEIERLKKLVNSMNNTYSVGDFDFESYYAMLKDN